MRIGVVSDTHNHLTNVASIVELFAAAGVERVLHTGDITQAKTLHAFAPLGIELVGVYGNNDLERESLEAACRELGMGFVDPPLRLEWSGRRLLVVHDPLDLEGMSLGCFDVVLYGHDHWQRIERRGGTLLMNPGECAGHMVGHNCVGVVDLATLEPEILRF